MGDNIRYWIGILGEKAGLGLIVLVTIWDLLKWGALRFLEYRICWSGIVLIWVGVGLILASKRIDKTF